MEDGLILVGIGCFLLGLAIGAVIVWIYFSSLLAMRQHLADSMNGRKGQDAKREYAEELEGVIQSAAVIMGNKELAKEEKIKALSALAAEHPRVALKLGNTIMKFMNEG